VALRGADRYLLRFETSDENLFRIIHPGRFSGEPDRLTLLRQLKNLGYEAGAASWSAFPANRSKAWPKTYSLFAR